MIRALVFNPGVPNSARLARIPEPAVAENQLRVKMKAIGVCGTDFELLSGAYGWAPPGRKDLILGHESLGEVVSAPADSGFSPGDLVVGIVRHPDPVPCLNCAVNEWDMCRNGLYTEHGIKERDGFCREVYPLDAAFAVKVEPKMGELGVLLEPASVVAKAWEHIDRIGKRAEFKPRIALITGAGPVGLLAACMAVQRGLQVHVLDRVKEGPKPAAVRALDAAYYADSNELHPLRNQVDIVVECTGSDKIVLDMIEIAGPNSVVCLAGVSSGGRSISIDLGSLNRNMVLENEVVFGSVNANRRHYVAAAESLAKAPIEWLRRLITRRLPLERWSEAFQPSPLQIKTILIP